MWYNAIVILLLCDGGVNMKIKNLNYNEKIAEIANPLLEKYGNKNQKNKNQKKRNR